MDTRQNFLRGGLRVSLCVLALGALAGALGCRTRVALPPVELLVGVTAPGRSSTDLEQQVAAPLEQTLRGAPGLTRVRSRSFEGGSTLLLTFAPGTARDGAAERVHELLQPASLPPELRRELRPWLARPRSAVRFRYTVESPQRARDELWRLHDQIVRGALLQVRGVHSITSCGGGPQRVGTSTARPWPATASPLPR